MKSKKELRLAATADLHCTKKTQDRVANLLSAMANDADILLLAGDLCDAGLPEEAQILVHEIISLKVPIVAVLGNHDFESGKAVEIEAILAEAGVNMLDGKSCEVYGIGFAGVKGFCGGFGDKALQSWGETAIKSFVYEAVEESLKLESALAKLTTPQRVALLHYAPIVDTVIGEPPELAPFLGSSRLEEPLNRYPVTAVFHGHAHHGTPEGMTTQRVPVYNVAIPLLESTFSGRPPFRILEIHDDGEKNNLARNPAPEPGVPIFYSEVIRSLTQASIPILLGGGFALEFYTDMGRHIKDMDLFVYRKDVKQILALLNKYGFRSELNFPHWLGKVSYANHFIDIIFSSGNGLCEVDPLWFKHAVRGTSFGLPIPFCPIEEMIWSKAFVMERERYDGADIAHLLLKCGNGMDWDRLLWRFGNHWRVLFSHLILFDYIYPSEGQCIPQKCRNELFDRLKNEINSPIPVRPSCRGPLLSRNQYQIDTMKLGYRDARVAPEGKLSPEEAASWTAAADSADESQ